jgi:hypothetical protein
MKLWNLFSAIIILGLFSLALAGDVVTPSTSADSSKEQATPAIDTIPPAAPGQLSGQPASAVAQTPPVPMSRARIKFDETDFNFGSIQKGAQVTHNYWFVNEGLDTLIITKVQPTCGCTTTRNKGITVPPNGRSSIDISFDSKRFNGKVTKGIKIECNDSLNPYMELRFSSTINDPLQILETSPLEANFKTIASGVKSKMTINLTNIDSTLTKLVVIEQPSPEFIKIKFAKMKLKTKESTTIELSLSDNISAGPFASSLTIEAENKPDSRITIPILGTISAAPIKTTEATKK